MAVEVDEEPNEHYRTLTFRDCERRVGDVQIWRDGVLVVGMRCHSHGSESGERVWFEISNQDLQLLLVALKEKIEKDGE